MTEKSKRDYGPLDTIQEAMGVMGPWQITIAIALSFVNIPVAWQQLSITFLAPDTNFTCIAPSPANVNDSMVRACSVKVLSGNSTVEQLCTKFDYTPNGLESSLISDWDLVCEKKKWADFVQSGTMLGILVGNMLFSTMADRIGRKIPLLIAVIMQVVTGLLSTVMPSLLSDIMSPYIPFMIFKIISAIATGGTMLISFVLLMEVVGIKKRSLLSVLFHIPFIMGHMMIPALAYWSKTWLWLMRSVSLPPILLLSYYWLIPESPRWLLAVGRTNEARKVLEAAAKRNDIPLEKVNAAIESQENQRLKDVDESAQDTYNLFDLFKTPNLRIRTICIAINWFVCGLCYFGLAQYTSRLEGSIFLNVFISAVFGLLGILIVRVLVYRVSRLHLLMAGNIVAGISLLLIILIEYIYSVIYEDNMAQIAQLPLLQQTKVVLASIGVCAMSVSFTTIYLYTCELFPTVVRNAGLGLCSTSARVASMIAPFVASSKTSDASEGANWLAPFIFGIGPLIGAGLCLLLPETMDCQLPVSIEDGENFGKKTKNIPMEVAK